MKSKRKFYLTLSFLITSIGILFASALMATSAWFGSIATHTPTWKAGSEGAYFAYGNGKPRVQGNDVDQPYGITKPIHLYNLAWLHYLGFLDTNDVDDEYGLDNLRFELAADIDMTGWILPPIGTKDHPFVGLFDGQGHKISNLKISNSLNDYNRIPFGINRSDFPSKINIVGLFGVVGKYESQAIASYDTSANEIINTGITGLTVISKSETTLAGLAVGYLNGKIEGVAINNSNIDLSSSGGDPISSITGNISDYSLVGYAKKAQNLTISDPNDKLGTIQSSTTTHYTPTVSNPFLTQGGNEWGASIDMESLYTKMRAKMVAADYATVEYATYEEQTRRDNGDGTYTDYVIDESKTITNSYTQTNYYDRYRNSNNSYTNLYLYGSNDEGTDLDNQSVHTAAYTFGGQYAKNDDNYNNYKYVGLSGGKNLTSYTYKLRSNTINNKDGFVYYDTDTSMYLSTTNGTSLTGTSEANASFWIFDNSHKLYTHYNNNIYYLNNNNGTPTISTTSNNTIWYWDETNNSLRTGTLYLYYDSTWKLIDNLTIPEYYTIANANGNYYLTVESNSLTSTSNSSNASKWYFTKDTNQYLYTVINGATKYVNLNITTSSGCTGSSTSYDYSLVNSAGTETLRKNGNTLTANSNGNTGFLTIGNGSVNGSANSTNLTITFFQTKTYTMGNEDDNRDITTYTENSESKTAYSNETYFPLTWSKTAANNPDPNNTGYIVGGGRYTDNASIGDVRLAAAYITRLFRGASTTSASTDDDIDFTYNNNELFAYTYDTTTSSSGLVKIGDKFNSKETGNGYVEYSDLGLQKYYSYNHLLHSDSGSRTALGTMLGASGNDTTAYGLHFMNADISNNYKTTVPYALINGTQYKNYELPLSSIDFNLKTNGYINFFAATYFINATNNKDNDGFYSKTNKSYVSWGNSNNSFFSLHSIDRGSNPLTIDSIKEIDKIYLNDDYDETDPTSPKYVYTYRSGGYDTGVRDTSGNIIVGTKSNTQVFDTYWLTDPDYNDFYINSLYYFEIPVNKGEFALGSTSGNTSTSNNWPGQYKKNGAYLLYLDIGASAKNTDGITIADSSITVTEKYLFPYGVDFGTISTTNSGSYTSIKGGETAAVSIPADTIQNISFTFTPKTTNKALLTVSDSNCTTQYKTVGTEVKDPGGGDLPIVLASSSATEKMEREIFYNLSQYTEGISIAPTITTTHIIGEDRVTNITYGTAVAFNDELINSFETFEPENPIVLYVVDYSNVINATSSDLVSIDSTYDVFSKTQQATFVTTAPSKITQVVFTNLDNLTQTIGVGDDSVSVTYHLIVMNNNDSESQVGEITLSSENKLIVLVCVQSS